MFNKRSILIICILQITINLIGQQDCKLTLEGNISDTGTGEPLEFVNIYVEETGQGTTSDSLGYYQISKLCPGHLHLSISHIGCQSQEFHLNLEKNSVANYTLNHTDHVLHDVHIVATQTPVGTQFYESINDQVITDKSYASLSDLTAIVPGVSAIKNGSGISKPIVNGLYGNRLTIFNNGVAQSGQQWGNDHSPEIDPLTANSIKVIKGVSAIQYPDGNLGSIILVEPKNIPTDPHLHGRATYFFKTNGRGHGTNIQLQQSLQSFAYRASITGKFSGDLHTPDYYLNNTGGRELNVALQLEKQVNQNWWMEVYLSSFNAQLGVMRGSHIGNLTDLQDAFSREVPFYTEDTFSYSLDAPSQDVNHHLIKIKSKYFHKDNLWSEVILSAQYNDRDEFDIRRGNLRHTPALSIQQLTIALDANVTQELHNGITMKAGFQVSSIDNENNSDTGISPLIPNYFQYKGGGYVTASLARAHALFDIGLRYDLTHQRVAYLQTVFPRDLLRDNNTFHTFGSSAGVTYSFSHAYSASLNIGLSSRNPAINELYSFGLHQGVSGIEQGDNALTPELSLKTTFSLSGDLGEAFYWEVLGYYQLFDGYIYLQPEDELRLTIRGAFPVYTYIQTDASISGVDTYVKYQFSDALQSSASYSYLHGWNQTEANPLPFMPSNTLSGQLSYEIPKIIHLGQTPIENLTGEVSHTYTFEQANYEEGQDFLAPPEGYHLTDIKIAGDLQLKKTRLRINLSCTNLFNIAYRDILNRQRYFADDVGRSVNLGMNLKF